MHSPTHSHTDTHGHTHTQTDHYVCTYTLVCYIPNKSNGYEKGYLRVEHLSNINYKTDIGNTEIKPVGNTICMYCK